MGLMDSSLGGLVGGERATVANGLIEDTGGVQGIINRCNSRASRHGQILGGSISADQIHKAFGQGAIAE